MTIAVRSFLAATLSAASLFAQQKFEAADVQVSPKMPGMQFARMTRTANGRYEVRAATMVDLIRIGYGIDSDRIVGGPPWVELDRFDIVAKMPDPADRTATAEMMKALLADRFKLVAREEKRPLAGFALTVAKKPLMKPGDDSGDTGCHVQQHNGPVASGGPMLMMMTNGQPTRIELGAGGSIEYECRNMTMDSFIQFRGLIGTGVGNKTVLNQTGLDGKWDFHLHYSIGMLGGNSPDRIAFSEALEKQLGLKLSEISVPTPVVAIGSVERKPTPNPPGTAEALPPLPKAPTAFDAASIRPSQPGQRGGMTSMRGNRFTTQNNSLHGLVIQAFRSSYMPFNQDAVTGLPSFADSARYDVTATAGVSDDGAVETAPMIRSLLEERFKMKWHKEERPVDAYTLIAVKPKMKKADPASRSHCVRANGPAGSPPGTQTMTCQNIAMDDFANYLMAAGPGLNWPVKNATGLKGGWDFSITYGRGPAPVMASPAGAGAERNGAPVAEASDPTGSLTLFEAIEKLGLKLEMEKRLEEVVVIDHLEEKPTGN
ncbi:MAG TPA: TIGR03435 family protein [Bryobacteraceae bacterium]|nr:TIGR03435 family protein [Bryobacteraceae bacterium]